MFVDQCSASRFGIDGYKSGLDAAYNTTEEYLSNPKANLSEEMTAFTDCVLADIALLRDVEYETVNLGLSRLAASPFEYREQVQ
jgi:hypothetical protein